MTIFGQADAMCLISSYQYGDTKDEKDETINQSINQSINLSNRRLVSDMLFTVYRKTPIKAPRGLLVS